ncbi:hypothetical protein G9C98_007335 [Cotesia typhae]|uniref:Muskelin N-terminal domain-containing protein n=1 Tax=Cotesia typhae TaxID=2053667 RepID=A0A8J5VAB9_9HYME|nr:hypothetical protein G9C98_007335 [Cotesia typhae]
MASSDISDDKFECKTLEYRVFRSSSYSPTYLPENILVDKPQDQSSRWSSDHDHYPQYLVLKLSRPAIVKFLTFGKFEKALVCNIKKFIIYGGMEHENMTELLKGSLKNDSVAETFEIKHKIGLDQIYYPIKYIKIMPIQSWGPSFNFSIWYVRLTGIDDPKIVDPCIKSVNQYFETEILRLCMKYFRCIKQTEIFETLGKVANVQLEDHRLSYLYDILVNKGDYLEAERFITDAVSSGLIDEYTKNQPYCAAWTKVTCDDPRPGMRGGHQMVFDSVAEIIYLFGGWNGHKDLSDLWSYDIREKKWTLICQDTESVGGPGARSCHKMCLDPEKKQLFTLGKYLDTQYRCAENLKSDFYVYDIQSNEWTKISDDTSVNGGPKLIFDHQICMDVENRVIYVFGGRILVTSAGMDEHAVGISLSSVEPIFSDLYSYDVSTNTWKLLACDIARSSIPINVPTIKSRVGHSMLFHPSDRKLYIFSGQRSKEYLNDFFTFDVDTSIIEHISLSDFESEKLNQIPAAGYTQRATIDSESSEIYVLSGFSKNKEKRDENVHNSFWVYKIKSNTWSCVYRNENVGEKYWNKMQDFEPCPRFAHQLVYDNVRKIHYLFGGNPGRTYLPKLRLDDFWELKLSKPQQDQILTRCKLIIRKHKFKELAFCNSMKALEYLQKDISEIIDHNDVEQTKDFQLLTSVLFYEQNLGRHLTKVTDISSNMSSSDILAKEFHQRRTKLFDQLIKFFPEKLTQPRTNLVDLLLL